MIVVPVPSVDPEVHEPEYQFQLPPVPKLPPVRVNTEVLPEHIGDCEDSAETAETEIILFKITILEVTQLVILQVPSALTK